MNSKVVCLFLFVFSILLETHSCETGEPPVSTLTNYNQKEQQDAGSQRQILQQLNEKMENFGKKITQIENLLLKKSFECIQPMSFVNNGPVQVADKLAEMLKSSLEPEYNRNISNDIDKINSSPDTLTERIFFTPGVLPKDCSEISTKISGSYVIKPARSNAPFFAYCDMETDGGGWTVFQFRQDAEENFNRTWNDFKNGFGDVLKGHWLGLDKLHQLTTSKKNELYIEMEDFVKLIRYARYTTFRVEDETDRYRISLLGTYNGTAGDAFSYHADGKFFTYDNDNEYKCAVRRTGAWWHKNCAESNLNAQYFPTGYSLENEWKGIYWTRFRGSRYSMMRTKMMVRPTNYK